MPGTQSAPAPEGRGHSKQLDRGKIVAAALALAREGGDKALSMRKLAARLGVDVSALYWHFRNKEELMASVASSAAEQIELEVPSEGDWTARAMALCRSLRAQLRAHPELGLQAGDSPWTTPFNARANGELLRVLQGSGLEGAELLLAGQGLLHQVTALSHSEVLGAASSAEGVRRFASAVTAHLPDGLDDAWRDLRRLPVEQSFDRLFEDSVGAMIAGLALRIETASRAAPASDSFG